MIALACLIVLVIALAGGGTATHAGVAQGGQAAYFRAIRTLGGTGKGSLTAAELATQNAAIDRTLSYTPYVRIAGSQHREVALTFDDGPGPYTPEVLATLEREDAPGTFFEVGVAEHDFHAWTSEIAARGFPIGDHTVNHPAMPRLSRQDQQAQVLQQATTIERYGAPYPRLFRPPYGQWNSTTVSVLRGARMLMVLWSVDTSDYQRPGVQAIVSSAVSGARPGAIILMHDAGGDRSETVVALPKIITELRKRGYRLVTVPQLLVDNPPPANQQITSVTGSGG
ncbi:MAG: polysaccharide deacetylase family protein [Solirubrobacteraceae bacterium]